MLLVPLTPEDQPTSDTRSRGVTAVVRALEAMRDRPDRTPLLLEHTELPVLLIQGDDDPAIDALDPEEGHVTRIVTDTAHMGVLTDPHTFAGIVHGWVADELERSA